MTTLRWGALALLLLTASLARAQTPIDPPPLRREFRAAWIATVANIDWPTKPGLPVARQKAQLRTLLDRAKTLRLNAVILQVRPACDALYASEKEPWSAYLTGEMGRAPEPFYDPLAFAVDEAHRRGLELHAWFNPFRARKEDAAAAVAPGHISATRPDLVRRYGRQFWCDPGEPDIQQHALDVVLDVVRRYDVDGVHIDDYFYPYPIKDAAGNRIPFPDEPSWQKYVASGGTLARDDWRRANVDGFVERLYTSVKMAKPWVKVGISPFGIARPGNPPQIRGLDPFTQLFADSAKWLNAGWCDYFSPQLYWRIEQRAQSFPVLLHWWLQQNPTGRHIWPGSFSSQVSQGKWPRTEIEYQVRTTRGIAGAEGNIHFSMKALVGTLGGHLRATVYEETTLVPPCPWLGADPPRQPVLALAAGTARWRPDGPPPFWWAVQTRTGGKWSAQILFNDQGEIALPSGCDAVAVRAIDRVGNVSAPAVAAVAP